MSNLVTFKAVIVGKLRQIRLMQFGAILTLPIVLAISGSHPVLAERSETASLQAQRFRYGRSHQFLAQRERRTALVIGNGAYGLEGKLNNPSNDAADVAKALQELGFEVTLLTDVGKKQVEEAIN